MLLTGIGRLLNAFLREVGPTRAGYHGRDHSRAESLFVNRNGGLLVRSVNLRLGPRVALNPAAGYCGHIGLLTILVVSIRSVPGAGNGSFRGNSTRIVTVLRTIGTGRTTTGVDVDV